MKKFLILAGLLFFSFLLYPKIYFSLSAQEPTAAIGELDFSQAYQDYLFIYNHYLETHKEYVIAKNQYETYGTLTSKTVALEQTVKMLEARDEVVATFLTALRMKMSEETQIGSPRLSELYSQLDQESIWFREHSQTLTSAGAIPDLITLSNQAQNRYLKTEGLIYESLLEIFLYQENLVHQEVENQIEIIDDFISQVRENGDKDVSIIERWLLEAKNKKTRAEEKLKAAASYKTNLFPGLEVGQSIFNRTAQLLEESHQYLKEVNLNLVEIIKEIKRAD
jgi:hypothetical protein